jgi:hypothetical protein
MSNTSNNDIINFSLNSNSQYIETKVRYWTAAQATLGTSTAVLAATSSVAASTVNKGFTQPSTPRNLVVTPTGTAGNVTAVSVVVFGRDLAGNQINESFLLTAGALTAATGSRAFAQIDYVSVPAVGAATNITIGVGSKLGLSVLLTANASVMAFVNGVKEGTLPTFTTSTTDLSMNTCTFNTALSGVPVSLIYFAI